MQELTKRLAGVAVGFCLGLRVPGVWGCLELGEISPLGHSEGPPVDFKKSRSATSTGKPTQRARNDALQNSGTLRSRNGRIRCLPFLILGGSL